MTQPPWIGQQPSGGPPPPPPPHPGYQPSPGYQQQPPGFQQQPLRPRAKGSKLAWILCAGLLVVVVLAFVAMRVVLGSIGSKDLQQAWQIGYDQPYSVRDQSDWLIGSWVVDGLIVRATAAGLAGNRIEDGSPAWTMPAPAGSSLCSVSRAQTDGVAVVAYGGADKCATVAGVDLRTGKQTFATQIKAPVAGNDPTQKDVPELAVTGTVAVSYLQNEIEAHALTDGRKLWSKDYGGAFCLGLYINALAADAGQVAVSRQCGQQTDNLMVLDAADGKEKWSSFQSTIYAIVSASPVVIHVSGTTDVGDSPYVGFDETGKAMAQFSELIDGDRIVDVGHAPAPGRFRSSRTTYAVVGSTLYAQVQAPIATTGKTGQVVAIDLTTGHLIWKSSGHKTTFRLIRADEQGVLGLEDGALLRLPAATGKTTLVADLPVNGGSLPSDADLCEVGGTVLVAAVKRDFSSTEAVTAYR